MHDISKMYEKSRHPVGLMYMMIHIFDIEASRS